MADSSDVCSLVMDEIALEGLDGITIEGLFVRLKDRPEFSSSLNQAYQQYIWDIICNFSEIDIFELPEPRKPLVIYNRYDHVDPELGMVLEPETAIEDLYPHAPVDDKVKGLRGSCTFYVERVSVYKTVSCLSLQEVLDKWSTKIVIVASQKMRNLALMGATVDPQLELTILQYCILERIGRSRHLGEVTQGKVSLQITGEDPKALFYHRKFLMKHGLIVKQIHHQKSGSQNCSGTLLHLPRFYVERWPKVLFLTKCVIEILRGCKDYIADYEEIRRKLGLTHSLKKLFQTTYFQRFVRTDLRLPYRHFFPEAKENEWKSMNHMKEKMIRVVQLVDPNADVEIMSTRDEEFDMEDEEHNEGSTSRDEFSVVVNRSFLSQVYQCVEAAGVNGYSQMELVQKMGLPKLCARTVSRNLLKIGVASTFMNDVGRQRVSRFRARKWDQQCTRIQVIARDIQHMRAELLSKALGAGHDVPNVQRSTSLETSDTQQGMKRAADITVEDLKSKVNAVQGVKRSSDATHDDQPAKIPKTEDMANIEIPEIDTSTSSTFFNSPLSKFQSKEAMRKYFQHQTKEGPVMTYRIFKRINMILEYVKIHKVVDDYSKILKLINEEEEREGLNMKIDKKSLLRLLIRLKEDGHLTLHSYILTDGIKIKNMIFVCENNVAVDHPAIISAIEQAKMKLFIVNRESINVAGSNTSVRSAESLKATNKKQKMTFEHDKKIGRKYGFCPKFIRMRTLHQFLFYLVYGYEGDSGIDQNKVFPFLESKDVMVDDCLKSELTQVYFLDIHWKMFIPPLPVYSVGSEGWSIMCDLLLRLPLSIFVRIFKVCYVVTGLNEYLQHPVRRHFLVSQLPVSMRNGLMAFRKYIFSIHEVLQCLCYIGLVQFGPQRFKEKDQVLIYLNRKTSLLDTTSSKPGYHQISNEDYQEIKYEFHTIQDVETYWYNLWNICINTQLGGRMCAHGKDIVLEHLSSKPQMQEALLPVRPSRALARDTGEVPGDRKGAAGLDSAIFAHLERNWNWANVTSKTEDTPKKIDQRKFRLMNMKAVPVNFTKSAIIVKRSINYLQKGRFSALRSEHRAHAIPPPGAEIVSKKRQRKQTIRRIVEKRKKKHKPIYDEIDLKALQLMSKLRVEWSTEEDTLLLLCKVASMYLYPNSRQIVIALSAIRDILHQFIPEAQNKTSKACQRRILYMMKNLATSNNLAMNLEELKQDDDICERFGTPEDNARSNLESVKEYDTRIHEKFRLLVTELQGRSNRLVTASETYLSTIPDKAEDFWKLFDVVEPKTVIKIKGVFQDIKNIVDIHCSVVNTIIHSSLCSTTDKTSSAYQLFRVYQQYPDSLLRASMAKLRQDQMVSVKKSYSRNKQKGNCLPLSSSPYQLSISYLQLIQTKYQYGVFSESYKMLKDLSACLEALDSKPGMQVSDANGGAAATIVELLCKQRIMLSVEIPDQVIVLDPWVSEKDETYSRVVQRYKDILRNCKGGHDLTTSALFRTNLEGEQDDPETENYITISENIQGDDINSKSRIPCNEEESNIDTMNTLEDVKKCSSSHHDEMISVLPQSTEATVGSSFEEMECMSGEERSSPAHNQTSNLHNEGQVLSENISEQNMKLKDCSLECLENLQNTTISEPESQNDVYKESVTNRSNDIKSSGVCFQNTVINESIKEVLSDTSSSNAFQSNEVGSYKDKTNMNEMDSCTLDKHKKWGRLDFEWISDTEWDIDSEICERAIEEPEETDTPDDDKMQRDYANSDMENEDCDGGAFNNQNNLVARAASRIALFMMKEEMDDSNQMENNQHAHDFFVVNSCSVFCHLHDENEHCSGDVTSKRKQDISKRSKLLSLKQEEIDEILNRIKSKAIVDIQVPCEEELSKSLSSEYWSSVRPILDFVKEKKHIGATLQQIRFFCETTANMKFKLGTILSELMERRFVLRTGVTTPRFVHLKYVWPWLAHTFKFLRLEREKMVPSGTRIVNCSEGTDECSSMTNETNETSEQCVIDETPPPPEQPTEIVQNLQNIKDISTQCNENLNLTDGQLNTFSQKENCTDGNLVRCNNEEESDVLNDKTSEKEVKELDVGTIGRRGSNRKTKQLATQHPLGTVVGSKEMRKVAQNLGVSEKDQIHIFIRPWIRVNGSLNRRVLDRFLGAVLGHAMYLPGQSLHSFALRFQPALQPIHTRELIEILQSLGCVKLLVWQQRQRVTLFSKPQRVNLVDADGTEDEEEIIIEPEANAICRLGQFIGDKSYNQDFMAAQESMCVGQGPKATVRRRKSSCGNLVDE